MSFSKNPPIQLRWSVTKKVHTKYAVYNFGKSKGKTFERVIIYPTEKMGKWVYNNSTELESSVNAKFYVAITRAKNSIAIVTNFPNGTSIDGMELFCANKI